MYYIVESSKSFYEVTVDLVPVVQRHGFAVLARHDLSAAGAAHDSACDEECAIFDIASERLREKLLTADIRSCLSLPWRIAVFTERGVTRLGLLRPTALPASADGSSGHADVVSGLHEAEETLCQIVDQTR